MDSRAAKLELARKKLRDHQEQKLASQKETASVTSSPVPVNETALINITENEINSLNNNEVYHPENKVQIPENDNLISYIPVESVNATEILISSKRQLDLKVEELQSKLIILESKNVEASNQINASNQTIQNLNDEIKNIKLKYDQVVSQLSDKEKIISDLQKEKCTVSDENSNLLEQLEFVKTLLTAKETENNSLHSKLCNIQNQLDSTQLHLQQLTNGMYGFEGKNAKVDINEEFAIKVSHLEQQIKHLQKEKEQISSHYEHYARDLNEQMKAVGSKNQELLKQVDNLSNRENSLVEQIGDLEIRLQNTDIYKKEKSNLVKAENNSDDFKSLQHKYDEIVKQYNELSEKYEQLKQQNIEYSSKINELMELKQPENRHDEISITKLNADIASDKIAAQRATEQNKKLKQDVHDLEEAFVKMSKDKLELTEKLSAEKYLNRELTIKLAETEEKAKEMFTTLKAKDDEMIRLLGEVRDLEKKQDNLTNHSQSDHHHDTIEEHDDHHSCDHKEFKEEDQAQRSHDNANETSHSHSECDHHVQAAMESKENDSNIPRGDAMKKLQDRFLKIMGEVADLSDEKHRLEHIILQLQNETDTICEYIALYQQQRSLLKRRDEERTIQLKMFETECSNLKRQLEELTAIFVRLSEDEDVILCLQRKSRFGDIERVMKLLTNLNSSSLIDPVKKNADFKDFYPCSCCSGKLIEV